MATDDASQDAKSSESSDSEDSDDEEAKEAERKRKDEVKLFISDQWCKDWPHIIQVDLKIKILE